MRNKRKKDTIEIQEDTRIGDYILEEGDKIEVLNETKFKPSAEILKILYNHTRVLFDVKDYVENEKGIRVVNMYSNVMNDPFDPESILYLRDTDIQEVNNIRKEILQDSDMKTKIMKLKHTLEVGEELDNYVGLKVVRWGM